MRLLLILSVLISACSSMKKSDNKHVEISQKQEDKIVFLVFKISNDSANDNRTVSLINQIETDGVFKENPNKFTYFPNQLTVEFLEENQVVKTIYLDHPLFIKSEYNEGKEWKSKFVILQEAEFYFRFQKSQKETIIKIYEQLQEKEKTEIYSIKL